MEIKNIVRDISDFPSKGIIYRDISPILHNCSAFKDAIDCLCSQLRGLDIDVLVGIESKGFLFASPIAMRLGTGIVMAKKRSGTHPNDMTGIDYEIEMGTNHMEIMPDAIKKGERILIVDDVIATGETAKATANIISAFGGVVVGFTFLAHIGYFDGIEKLKEIAPVICAYGC